MTDLNRVDHFALSRQIAYRGNIGKQRERFCVDYIQRKQRIFAEMQKVQAENTTAIGETISCGKGCTYCCLEYVEATIQEGESIVYFLYRHDDVLERFVRAYPAWKQQVQQSGDFLKEVPVGGVCAAENKSVALATGLGSINEYAAHKIPCPFLTDGACLIYEIRPLTCAGLIATTPREWCDPAIKNKSERRYQTAPARGLYDLSFYHHDLEQPVQSLMPVMVYNILQYGLMAQFDDMPGLEGMVAEYTNDPEVRPIIQKFMKNH